MIPQMWLSTNCEKHVTVHNELYCPQCYQYPETVNFNGNLNKYNVYTIPKYL